MVKPKAEVVSRKVWRMTPDAPQGEFVESRAVEPVVETSTVVKILTNPPPPSWRASSFDLLHGLEVHDFADTVPTDVYDELFSAQPPI